MKFPSDEKFLVFSFLTLFLCAASNFLDIVGDYEREAHGERCISTGLYLSGFDIKTKIEVYSRNYQVLVCGKEWDESFTLKALRINR